MNELADIVEPVQAAIQAPQYALPTMTVTALVIGILAGVYWWLKNKNRRRTLRYLHRLQRDFGAGHVSARALAYAVAAALQNYLRIHRLHANQFKASGNDIQRVAWRNFVERLDTVRYQHGHELDPAQVDALVRDAVGWARRLR